MAKKKTKQSVNVKIAKEMIESYWSIQPPSVETAIAFVDVQDNLKEHIRAVRDILNKALKDLGENV